MSHWNADEIHDSFNCEGNNLNHLLPYQDGEDAIELATLSDSHKKPRYESFGIAGSSILHKDKAAPTIGIPKFIAGSNNLVHQHAKISTTTKERVNDALCGVQAKEQRNGDDDLFVYDCPNIGDFDRMFRNIDSTIPQGSSVTNDETSWFSSPSHGFHGMEDTLQSIVLSSVSEFTTLNSASGSHGLWTNALHAISPSKIGNEMLFSTGCSSFPLYSDAERKGKSVLSKLVHDNAGLAYKNWKVEQIGYENECSEPNMINVPKDINTSKKEKINPTLESAIQSLLGHCGSTQNAQDQELLSSVVSAPQPCSLEFLSKQNVFSQSCSFNCLNSYNPQAQILDVLAMQRVPPAQATLDTVVIGSSAFPYCGISDNSSFHTPQTMGMPSELFSIASAVPLHKNEKQYVCQQLPAALVANKPLGQHATAGNSLVQRRYKFEDEIGGDKEPASTNLTLPAISRCSSTHENSFMSPFLDDASLNATSFQQLQLIVDLLGDRIKLCMRDSFYRLARSAEQRHNYGTVNNATSESNPMGGLEGAKEPKRPAEFEGASDTNAIERAVAYLVFHRSLDSGSGNVADDPTWFTSPSNIHDAVGH
ncbi:hypothetical protein HPP92_013086 [Vanilla planifolia]|uniref:Uncharacterized protein n=1 Tax=Vanilla planifolia TaxID=51239 RepID=A0A835UXN2_VANPL|nr:hypothetical protein HPP92_013086 [Vanilla planifolia]